MLSATSQYALRALARLARLSPGQVLLGRDLAGSAGIPPKYLSKVMLTLRNAGLVAATRGTGGGYMLVRPAGAVYLVEIVQLFESRAAWSQCLLRPGRHCSGKHACTAHPHWSKVRRGYLEFLEHTTVSQIALPRRAQPARSARA